MTRLMNRTAAVALSVIVALGAAAPCAAGEPAAARTPGTLTRLSPASRQILVARAPARQQAGPVTPGSFFKSTRGKVTLVLMGVGTAFTLWSIQRDRKPVKSPVR